MRGGEQDPIISICELPDLMITVPDLVVRAWRLLDILVIQPACMPRFVVPVDVWRHLTPTCGMDQKERRGWTLSVAAEPYTLSAAAMDCNFFSSLTLMILLSTTPVL